jgi:hypothetical protein
MEWITKQGMFGVVAAVAGVAAGIFLSRIIRRRRDAAAQKKRDATPRVYASRQEMRKAERERAKKG